MDLELLSNEMSRNGISHGEMAKRLGISRSTFYRKMRGITEFYLKEIQKTGEILGYEVAEKIFFSEKSNRGREERAMRFETEIKYRPFLQMWPKAKPLAQTLIAAAAEQGVSMNELELSCKLALEAYREAMDNSNASLTEFQSKAESSLYGL